MLMCLETFDIPNTVIGAIEASLQIYHRYLAEEEMRHVLSKRQKILVSMLKQSRPSSKSMNRWEGH